MTYKSNSFNRNWRALLNIALSISRFAPELIVPFDDLTVTLSERASREGSLIYTVAS
jgi:hypothetical protein